MGSPMRGAGVSFSTSAKETTSKPQSQREDPQGEGGVQDKAELPTPKTNPAPTPSETLDRQCLFPEGPPQGYSQTHDAPIRHSTDQENEREETDRASDQETTLLEWLMQWGLSTRPKSAKHEEYFKSRLNQMYSSMDKQEDWIPTCMTLLDCMTQLLEKNLLLWQDRDVIACLRLLKLQGALDVNAPDAVNMMERICECIRGRHGELRQPSPPPKTHPQTGYDTRNAPEADPATHQHSHSRDD